MGRCEIVVAMMMNPGPSEEEREEDVVIVGPVSVVGPAWECPSLKGGAYRESLSTCFPEPAFVLSGYFFITVQVLLAGIVLKKGREIVESKQGRSVQNGGTSSFEGVGLENTP